jgi:hypothetical protein
MSADHIYRCDGPGCDAHVQSTDPPPRAGFLHVLVNENRDEPYRLDFCGWECAMRYGAGQPIPEVIPFDDGGSSGG